MKKITGWMFMLALCGLPVLLRAQPGKNNGEFYQVTVYHFTSPEQQQSIERYLQEALVPALHRQRIQHVGVFIPLMNDTVQDKRIYVFMPLNSLQQVADLSSNLMNDKAYVSGGATYLDATYDKPAFGRKETMLLKSFPMAPVMQLPKLKSPKTDHVYEFRSYESPSEKIHLNKVQMFNEGGETKIFSRLNFNGVFYSAAVIGSRMPNLVYMTSFENMDDRNAHWKAFGSDPEWKTLSGMPMYQHNVSKQDIILMKAAAYSDF